MKIISNSLIGCMIVGAILSAICAIQQTTDGGRAIMIVGVMAGIFGAGLVWTISEE